MTLLLAAVPTPAYAWWNGDWSDREKITLDTSAAGANIDGPIGTTPVLVRLHAGNFKFDKVKPDGSDIRFVAGDDATPLKFHVEKFDSLLGEAFVWVSVPDLKPGAQTSVYLYYGNAKASAADDAKGSYDPDTVLVYHFGEKGGPARDFTQWANNAQGAGIAVDGSLIAGGLRLDGQTLLHLPASQSLSWADGQALTWSAWIKTGAPQPGAILFSRRDGANAFLIGVDNGAPFVAVTSAAGTQRSAPNAALPPNGWHHIAVVASGPRITLFVDGAQAGGLAVGIPALAGAAVIGGDTAAPAQPAATDQSSTPPTAAPTGGFVGEMDELEISRTAHPAGFIKVAAVGQGGDNGKFLTSSVDEESASWMSGYLTVILKSVTLDGWVVIGILMVMAALSWVVMVDKASYLSKLARANGHFLTSFREVAADLTVLDQGGAEAIAGLSGKVTAADKNMVRNSSLYRIYHVGAEELRRRFAGVRSRTLSAQSIAAIRAALDSGLVREIQRLNRQMVLLTIAISGGPFLGLLGTVIGVMITFASIAASGDVNVNAIAPGIAAALVATVAGLIVAIPALFGYNYLTSRIRDLTSDMQVFVDEFTTKMAEFYSGQAGG
ncbi:MAG: DUF2341 domain-containing protein [Rhizomicrobium sp.]